MKLECQLSQCGITEVKGGRKSHMFKYIRKDASNTIKLDEEIVT